MKYFIKRLAPFYVLMLVLEFVFALYQLGANYQHVDFSPLELGKMFAILGLTATVSFLYMMIPYLLYLLFLPSRKQNSRLDKIVTYTLFVVFSAASVFEEAASLVFWDEFTAAFNFIAVDYLVYTHEVVSNIWQSYPIVWMLLAVVVAALLLAYAGRKFLLTTTPAPKFGKRCMLVVGWAFLCVLSYFVVDSSKIEISKNYYNNELAKQGTYSLFSAFLKNELAYDTFYLTQSKSQNLQILQNKLGGKNIKFINPQQNIARRVTSDKPENKANVMVVLMESMSAKYLDENRSAGERQITPNLGRLSKQGIFFANTYATGTRSVRGIEALTLSVPPLPGMSLVRRPGNENLYTIGSIFRAKGYDTKWLYGGYGYFDNMNYFFENNGFEVVDRKAWAESEVTFANAWGAADEDTYAKMIKESDESYAAGKPFFNIMLSISNHRPYTFPEGKIDLPSKEAGRDGGVKYADYAIGQFVEMAKNKPWFDNTVFVFVADHTAGAAGDAEIELEGHHIPLIFYAPKLFKPKRVDMPVSQIDALPTLLGLLNFDYESRFYGQDALKPNYESRFFVSNYQKVGYVKKGTDVILKPVKQYSVEPHDADKKIIEENLREGIAFYNQASDWVANLKE